MKCRICKTKNNLMKSSSTVYKGKRYRTYVCKKCNAKEHKEWYHRNPKNKTLVQIANMKSYAKRFGYKLTKI